jgi:hypothetical protein
MIPSLRAGQIELLSTSYMMERRLMERLPILHMLASPRQLDF